MNQTALMNVPAPQKTALPRQKIQSGGEIPDGIRGDDQPLYDRQIVPAGTVLNQLFFFNLGHNGLRSWADTNCPQPNRVPGEFVVSVSGFAVRVLDNPALADFFLLNQGLFVFNKNNSRRFQMRMSALGGGGGFSGLGQGAVLPVLIQNGPPSPNDYYRLKSNIALQAEDLFNCRIEFPQLPAGGFNTLATALTVEIVLFGMVGGLIDRR